MTDSIEVFDSIDFRLDEASWPFAEAHRDRIAAHWARELAQKPALWDGKLLGASHPHVENGVLKARFLTVNFSEFLAWRDWGYPDTDYFNVFGSAVIAGNDGGIIFGIMGYDTSNAGQIYPCGGSLEPGDVGADGRVDVFGATARELVEETGLDAGEAQLGGDFAVRSGQLLSIARIYRFDAPAAALARRIEDNLTRQDERELEGVFTFASPDELDPARSPTYALAAARHVLGRQAN